MNEERLIELMKQTFPSKHDLEDKFATKAEVHALREEMHEEFDQISDKLDILTASAHALDQVLEGHPLERLVRLEHHVGLPLYVPASEED